MSAKSKILTFIESHEFLGYLIALILSTLFIGFAPSSIAVGVFVFFAIRYAIIHKQKQKIDVRLMLPVILYLFFSLTMFWTIDDDETRKGIDRTVVLLLIPIAFNFIPKFSWDALDLILKIFTRVNVLFGLFFLTSAGLRYIQNSSLSVFTYHDLVSDLELHAIYVSVIFSISMFYVLSKKQKTITDILMIMFFTVLIILLSSKTMFAILILGFFVYIFLNRVKKIKLVAALLIGATIFVFASKNTLKRVLFEKETKMEEVWTQQNFGPVYLWTGTSIRILQLRILKEQIEEESIFWRGFGLFASKDNVKKRHLEFNTYPGFHSYNYHNQYAQTLSDTGILGLLLLITMLVVQLVKAFRSKIFLFIMASLTILFIFFTESLLYRQPGLFLFIILYCLINRFSIEDGNRTFNRI